MYDNKYPEVDDVVMVQVGVLRECLTAVLHISLHDGPCRQSDAVRHV